MREKENEKKTHYVWIQRDKSVEGYRKNSWCCCVSVCGYSLFKNVLCVHPSVILGQFDREDNTRNQQDTAASQTKPECVLKHRHVQLKLTIFTTLNTPRCIMFNILFEHIFQNFQFQLKTFHTNFTPTETRLFMLDIF